MGLKNWLKELGKDIAIVLAVLFACSIGLTMFIADRLYVGYKKVRGTH